MNTQLEPKNPFQQLEYDAATAPKKRSLLQRIPTWLLGLLFVVGVVGLFAAGYYAYTITQNTGKRIVETVGNTIDKNLVGVIDDQNNTDMRTMSDTTMTEPSAADGNWQVYENIDFGYRVSYPADWSIDTQASIANDIVSSLVFETDNPASRQSITIEAQGPSYLEWAASLAPGVSINREAVEIGDYDALQITTSEFGITHIVFNRGTDFVHIQSSGNQMTLLGVVGTLQFDEQSVDTTSTNNQDWDSYVNEEYGFEIQHPAAWIMTVSIIQSSDNPGMRVWLQDSENKEYVEVAVTENGPFMSNADSTEQARFRIDGNQIYEQLYPQGHCDGTNCRDPFAVYWFEKDGRYYSFLTNSLLVSGTEQEVMQSFELF